MSSSLTGSSYTSESGRDIPETGLLYSFSTVVVGGTGVTATPVPACEFASPFLQTIGSNLVCRVLDQWRSQGGTWVYAPRRSWKLAFVSGFWGQRPTDTQWIPLGDFRPPDPLFCPPVENSWLRPYSGSYVCAK